MAVTAVHPYSAAVELHLEVGREAFRVLGAMIALTGVEVYGSISDRVRALLEESCRCSSTASWW